MTPLQAILHSCLIRSLVVMVTLPLLLLCHPLTGQQPPAIDTQLVDTQLQASDSSSQKTAATAATGWDFSLSPYLWFAGEHGTVGALGHNLSIHASPGDLLSHLDIGLMGAAEARYKRFVLNGDMVWVRVSGGTTFPAPGLGAVSASATLGQFIWTSKGGYRVIDRKKIKADANVGVRYWHLGQTLNFNPSTLGINFNGSQNWADVLVGGRVQFPLGEKVAVDALGDVGGWNAAAKLDYQFAAFLSYKFSRKWALVAGYRYLSIDRRTGAAVFDTITSGALIGATFTFK
jgi:hypothetical protein